MQYEINGTAFSFITLQEDINNATVFHHFKDKEYKIVLIAKNSETLEDMVLYKQCYSPFEYYVRPAKMFFSTVDIKKYPQVKQKYRFEIKR